MCHPGFQGPSGHGYNHRRRQAARGYCLAVPVWLQPSLEESRGYLEGPEGLERSGETQVHPLPDHQLQLLDQALGITPQMHRAALFHSIIKWKPLFAALCT